MRTWILVAAAITAAALLVASCGGLLTAYLVNQLLDTKAPSRTWSGKITNPAGEAVEGLKVVVRAAADGDNNILTFDDATDKDGVYAIKYRWNDQVSYTLRVYEVDTILTEKYIGKVSLSDQTTDFVIQSAITTSVSGTVHDISGNPIQGALLIGGSVSENDPLPVLFVDNAGKTVYNLSGESGVYELSGPIAQKAVVCAYHPDHGFAYGVAEDTDGDGSVAIDIVMGNTGQYNVNVQVVDGSGAPIANQILSADRQFRIRLEAPYNLGSNIDTVVADNALFGGLSGNPSATHPSSATLIVQSTGVNGIADGQLQLGGGAFGLSLLKIDSSDAATALIQSANPMPLGADATVVVRVN